MSYAALEFNGFGRLDKGGYSLPFPRKFCIHTRGMPIERFAVLGEIVPAHAS